MPVFAALPPEVLVEFAGAVGTVVVPAGEVLFGQGDAGQVLYVVRSGRLEVLVDGAIVRVHGRGEAFGELALLAAGSAR